MHSCQVFGEKFAASAWKLDNNALLEAEENVKKQNFDRITLIKLNFADIDLLDFFEEPDQEVEHNIAIDHHNHVLVAPTLEKQMHLKQLCQHLKKW